MQNRVRVAIIGASYLQVPIIECAKDNGYETHVFAWKVGAVGERIADFFYPISITEKDLILQKCREIGISGICSIGSDLATITVNYIAKEMGLIGNTMQCTCLSTNKHLMRSVFERHSLPSPKSVLVELDTPVELIDIDYPAIVKPTDRSGSRGIFLINDVSGLNKALHQAIAVSFEKKALVESFIEGNEYSLEFISYRGKHVFLNSTKKYTTGAPHFVEKAQLEPSELESETLDEAKRIAVAALNALEVSNGASHIEIKVDDSGKVWLIEVGARMGGDLIGSHLVRLSTGIDMVQAVLDISLGNEPNLTPHSEKLTAGIRYIFERADMEVFTCIKEDFPNILVEYEVPEIIPEDICDSSQRKGYYLVADRDKNLINRCMPIEL